MLFSLHPSQGHWASSTAETVASGSVASQILLRGSTKLRDAASVLPFPPGSTSPEGGRVPIAKCNPSWTANLPFC